MIGQLWQEYGTEFILSFLSLLAVGISLFRAQAQETEAAAKAVTELAESSQDLRERVNALEVENRRKDEELTQLRQKAAQLPVLEAQVRYLTDTLTRVQGEAQAMREQFEREMQAKQSEIEALRVKGR